MRRFGVTAILAAAVAAAGIAHTAPATAATTCKGASAHPGSASLATMRRATLCLLNEQRTAHGLKPLRENSKLDRAAVGHSRSMVKGHYFEHGNVLSRLRAVHYSGRAFGENIAWGSGVYSTPKAIVNLWMHSPGHRANILRAVYRDIGIGIARGAPQRGVGGAATYTTDFGTP